MSTGLMLKPCCCEGHGEYSADCHHTCWQEPAVGVLCTGVGTDCADCGNPQCSALNGQTLDWQFKFQYDVDNHPQWQWSGYGGGPGAGLWNAIVLVTCLRCHKATPEPNCYGDDEWHIRVWFQENYEIDPIKTRGCSWEDTFLSPFQCIDGELTGVVEMPGDEGPIADDTCDCTGTTMFLTFNGGFP